MKNKKGFSLVEVLIMFTLICIIVTTLTVQGVRKMPDKNLFGFKKGMIVLQNNVSTMINSPAYGDNRGFKNLEPAITEFGETFGTLDKKTKFRDMFKYYLDVVDDKITCKVVKGSTTNEFTTTNCILTTDGVVYGIPDTNFSGTGTIYTKGRSASGGVENGFYLPIVIYPHWEKTPSDHTVDDNGIIVGVAPDGRIKFLTIDDDCTGANAKKMKCKLKDYLNSSAMTMK